MAKVCTFFPVQRTMCGITFYIMEGQNLARKKSSLSRRRVKYSAEFANTRLHASILKQGSKIASAVYKCLPEGWRKFWMYRAFTGEAMQLLKAGKTVEEAIAELKRVYVVVGMQQATDRLQYTGCRMQGAGKRRKYVKKDMEYWQGKTIKAQKRKAKREKLQRYAVLMARASKIGSEIYSGLAAGQRKGWHYKNITGMAMRLLKEEVTEELVRDFLMNATGSRNPEATGPEIRSIPVVKKIKQLPVLKAPSLFVYPRIPLSSLKSRRAGSILKNR